MRNAARLQINRGLWILAKNTDLVIAYIDLLHRHKFLVAEAYHQGRVTADEERRTERGIQDLRRQRTLVVLDADSFRLASSLSRHLDDVLQKDQPFSAVGGQIADQALRLPLLAEEAIMAAIEGRMDDLDGYVDAFNNAVFDLSDAITQALQTLRVLVDTRFAGVRTAAEKERQNRWYIQRAETLSEALRALQVDGLMSRLEEEPIANGLRDVYLNQIWMRLDDWRQSLLDITDILKRYLYRPRDIEPTGRRMRAFHLYLKRHPDYTVPEIEDLADVPEWATRAAPLTLLAHPDPRDDATREAMADLADALPAAPSPVERASKVGTLISDQDSLPQVVAAQPRPHQKALEHFFASVPKDGQALSALTWKRLQQHTDSPANGLDEESWLLCLVYERSLRRKRTQHLCFDYVERASSHPLDGVIVIRDILVSQNQNRAANP